VIVKLLLIGSVLALLAWVMRSRPSNHRLALTRMASVVIALCWIFAVINPDRVTWVANLIGVGRGTDLLLYVLVVIFTFTTVGQYQRLRQIDDRIAELARSQALQGQHVHEQEPGSSDVDE
jgi:small membrane protein